MNQLLQQTYYNMSRLAALVKPRQLASTARCEMSIAAILITIAELRQERNRPV